MLMFIHVTITGENVNVFPIHSHKSWEYICYEEGSGVLKTEVGDMTFNAGTVIVVPPNLKHGSCSGNGFRNICIHTDFPIANNHKLYLPHASEELRKLFSIIGNLYFKRNKYISVVEALLPALKDLILKEAELSVPPGPLSFVHSEISKNFANVKFDLSSVIKKSGYVDDVLRAKFKSVYGVTPKKYLDNLRIDLAKNCLRIYGDILLIKEIAEMCGFADALYFSRKFKIEVGVNPKQYIEMIRKH